MSIGSTLFKLSLPGIIMGAVKQATSMKEEIANAKRDNETAKLQDELTQARLKEEIANVGKNRTTDFTSPDYYNEWG